MAVVTALLAPACGDKGPGFLLVTVEPPTPAIAGIAKLDVSATLGGETRSAPTQTAFTLPTSLALDFGGRSGVTTVTVIARDSGNTELVRGSSMATVVAGETDKVTVKLGTTMMLPDGGMPDGGNPGVLQISPASASHDFGTQTIMTSSADTTFTVSNTGGTQTGLLTVRVMGPNLGDFVVSGDGCSGMNVPVAGSCTFRVKFLPASFGGGTTGPDRSATLEVLAAGSATQSSALLGKATCFLLSPAPPYAFGPVQTFNSSTTSITVRNQCSTAAGPLAMPTFAGTHASVFMLEASPTCTFGTGTLGNGISCAFGVTFTPASAGAKTATVTITTTAGGFGGGIIAALTGTGT